MRLHRLTVRAFGPFAGEERVDFDALTASGLFLLHGPTGAGKTSVLDAVCFALYGGVPGPRAATTRFRSDHAAEGVAPEVGCEFSVGPRRFEVTRSPAWERPKRRGDGTTTEQARVLVRELVDGQWTPLTSRLDEAGHLLESLLGMGQSQFTKLVLLPQGDFAAFLRSDADARRQMLERLFDTDRFSAVQGWLRDTQLRLKHAVDEARTVTREHLARAEQSGARLTQPSSGAEEPAPRPRVAGLLASATRAWEDATAKRAATQATLARARADHEGAVVLARRQADHARLAQAAHRLAEQADLQSSRRDRLRDAERALGVAPIAPALEQAESRLERARATLDTCVVAAAADQDALTAASTPFGEALVLRGLLLVDAAVVSGMPDDVLSGQSSSLRGQIGHLAVLAEEAAALGPARARLQQLTAAVDEARRDLDRAVTRAAQVGPELATRQEQLVQARSLARTVPAAEQAVAGADTLVAAIAERDRLLDRVRADEPACRRARDARDAARLHWLDCRERRLAQMAAELAERLVPGEACPVCGGSEHPAPARPGPGRVTEAQEQQARDAYEQAESRLGTLTDAAARLAERLAAARATGADLTGPDAARRREQALAALDAAHRARQEAGDHDAAIARLIQATQQASTAIDAARATLHGLETDLATRSASVAELAARCEAARGEDPGLSERSARLTVAAERLEAVQTSRRGHADALRAAATSRRTALAAARKAGFGDLAGALAAVVPDDERVTLETQVRAHDSELAAVTAQLRDPDLIAAAARPAPDLVQLRSAEVLAMGDDEAAAQRIAMAEQAVEELRDTEAALATHLADAEPLEQRYRTVAELARCADGTGGDNARRMSLSAYVLAARLEQVAQAASLRLGRMSGGRYSIEHSDEPARGGRRGGLGLRVVDAWTGRDRDTATLSGGESFYTSLALALGLADVVAAEAGGTAIETLFVDEGFGSLDEDTLEEVMDTLDSLRSGGRAVGLVSHVADLRHRIPAQLEVIKGRAGSHLQPSP